jgi:hypothetical protein
MPKRKLKKPQAQVQESTAKVRIDVKSDTPSYYVNFIGVSHTAYDVTLSAIKIPSPLTPEQAEAAKNGEIPLEPILQLVVPPLLVDGLIKALTDQKEKHEKTLAQQVKNNEAQHQHAKSPGTIH